MIIAFLGTGLMGLPMASNLLKAGYIVNVYNRSIEKTKPLELLGAKVYSLPDQAIIDADVIITMLDSEHAQESVLINKETLSKCKANSLIIDMASISPNAAIKHASLARKHQLSYLDAPVSGGTLGAKKAQLVVMVGGQSRDFNRAQPIFNALASKVIHIGPNGTGQVTKCANQTIVGITIAAVSEALTLAQQSGADVTAVRNALMGGFAASKVLDQHGLRMLERNFVAGGSAKVQLKDLTNTLNMAKESNLELPFTQLANNQYQELVNSGKQDLDHSALLLLLEQRNQIERT